MEDNDEIISSPLVALDAIQKLGYLTRLETPSDEWYEIGIGTSTASGIAMQTAIDLIAQGLVREVASGHPPGDLTTRAVSWAMRCSASNEIRGDSGLVQRSLSRLFQIWLPDSPKPVSRVRRPPGESAERALASP